MITVGAGFDDTVAGHSPTPLVDRDDEDTAVVLYTSGTTGAPKGAELRHANMIRNAGVRARGIGLTADDVVFGAGMNAAILAGATLTLLARFEPAAALRLLERDRVTVIGAVPTMYVALLQHPDRAGFDNLVVRLCLSGGASLPVEVLTGFESAFGAVILEGAYGLSETSPVASFNHADRPRKPGSIGPPVEGVQFRLVDADFEDVPEGEVGEIAIKGHNVMKGYLNKPEATAQVLRDGWFRTGDLARRDEDGYYFIVDRVEDLIIRGGVPARDRGGALRASRGRDRRGRRCAAPHPRRRGRGCVILKPGATVTADEIREFARERVAAYKYPRIVWITESLPTGATGKILKREIEIPTDENGR